MAVWLVRALDGSDPSVPPTERFSDVPSDVWWAPFVERLAALSVTQGCGDGTRYCPDQPVTRAQMATFLVRAFSFTAKSSVGFTDTAGNFHGESIRILAGERITAGCGDGTRYCPDQPVTRAQMATFLARSLDLIDRPAPRQSGDGRIVYLIGDDERDLVENEVTGRLAGTVRLAGVDLDGANHRTIATFQDSVLQSERSEGWLGDRLWLWSVLKDWGLPTLVSLSPDRQLIAYKVRTDRGTELWVRGLTDENPPLLLSDNAYDLTPEHPDPIRQISLPGFRYLRWSPDGDYLVYSEWHDVYSEQDDDFFIDTVLSEVSENRVIKFGRLGKSGTPSGRGQLALSGEPDGPLDVRWLPISGFLQFSGFPADIVIDIKGSQSISVSDTGLIWSPDGQRVAFTDYGSPAGNFGHYLYTADWDDFNAALEVGNNDALTALGKVPPGTSEVLWSADGRHLAYDNKDEKGYWVLQTADADGQSPPRRLASLTGAFSWSPVGNRLAYLVLEEGTYWNTAEPNFSLWMADADGANTKKISEFFGGENSMDFHEWSPDGTSFIYPFSVVESPGDYELRIADVISGESQRLSPTTYPHSATWSPNGAHLAFTVKYRPGFHSLWVADGDGANPRKIADDNYLAISPWWSPDSSRLAFTAVQRRNQGAFWADQVWMADGDGANPRLLSDDRPTDDLAPVDVLWLPDSSSLIYLVAEQRGNEYAYQLWKADQDGTGLLLLADNLPVPPAEVWFLP